MIRKLGSDPDKLYSYENLQFQLKKFGNFTLICAPIIISLRKNKREHVENIHKDFIDETQEEYNKEMNDLVSDLLNYKYI